MQYSIRHSKPSGKRWLLGVIFVLVVIVILIGLQLGHVIHIFPRSSPVMVTAGSATKGEPSKTTKSVAAGSAKINSSSSSQPGDNKSSISGDGTASLLIPTGDFVSNHTPGQHNSPENEVSVCNTSPGVSCQITFTKDGVTKSLPEQTTDRGGATYWNNWTPTSAGLSTGSWQVTAIASGGGQTKSATDATKLVIQ